MSLTSIFFSDSESAQKFADTLVIVSEYHANCANHIHSSDSTTPNYHTEKSKQFQRMAEHLLKHHELKEFDLGELSAVYCRVMGYECDMTEEYKHNY
jgi:phage terminase small subunit